MPYEPIFIVGSPRSGTSLLRVTLNRHPSIWLCDETNFFHKVYLRRRAFGDLSRPKARRLLISRYLATQRIKRLGLRHDALADVLMREGTSYASFFASLIRFSASEQGKVRFGEKTPHHALFTETLCAWYPHCTLIHIVRDPRDVVASLLRMPFASDSALANARLWLKYTTMAERSRHCDNYLLVQYEQFVSDPEAELRRILSVIGETYAPTMLVAEDQTNDVEWWFQRAQGPLQRDRMGTWREQLSEKQVALVEWATGHQMDAFGYEPTGAKASIPTIASSHVGAYLDYIRTRITSLPTLWYYWVQPTRLVAEEKAWLNRKA